MGKMDDTKRILSFLEKEQGLKVSSDKLTVRGNAPKIRVRNGKAKTVIHKKVKRKKAPCQNLDSVFGIMAQPEKRIEHVKDLSRKSHNGFPRIRPYNNRNGYESPVDIAMNNYFDTGNKINVDIEINYDFFLLVDWFARGMRKTGNYVMTHEEVVRMALLWYGRNFGYTEFVNKVRLDKDKTIDPLSAEQDMYNMVEEMRSYQISEGEKVIDEKVAKKRKAFERKMEERASRGK